MKIKYAILCMTAILTACSTPGAVTKVGTYKGNTLKIVTGPDISKKNTVMVNDRKKDKLPSEEQISSPDFDSFFKSVTGCTIDRSQNIAQMNGSNGPLFLYVPVSSC